MYLRSYARVRLVPGNGSLIINNRKGEEYLQNNDFWLFNCRAPLKEINADTQYDIIAEVGLVSKKNKQKKKKEAKVIEMPFVYTSNK